MIDETIFVTRPYFPNRKLFDRYVDEIWASRWMTNQGPLHEKFRNALKAYLQVDQLVPTVNGHLALEIALRGLQVQGEVITTPFTFASTVHAISLCGLKPIFCDIRKTDLTIDPEKIESLITDRTGAILPVHVYGHPCDIKGIEEIAAKYNLKVLYDAAHAFGIRYQGECIGLAGDASVISFHATKLFNSIEGGAIVCKDPIFTKNFEMLKNFGIEDEESIPSIGGNGKMNEFQAAMGLANLVSMNQIIQKRKEITKHYYSRLSNLSGLRFFSPDKDEALEFNYGYVPVLVTEDAPLTRDQLHFELKKANIITRKYFYPLVSDAACYKQNGMEQLLPVATAASKQVLTLPIYYDLEIETVDRICNEIINVFWKADKR